MTLQGWAARYFLRRKESTSPHTLRAYRHDLQALLSHCAREGARDPSGLTRRLLRGFLASLGARGLQRATIARRLAAVRSFTRFLAREGALESDPAVALRAPRHRRPLPLHLSERDAEKLLSAARTPRDRAVLETLYGGGLRVSELVSLDWDDVDVGAMMARVRGKGRKER
ncbi:MAG: site-specific integrase, partial [Planctomycetota bacterium]